MNPEATVGEVCGHFEEFVLGFFSRCPVCIVCPAYDHVEKSDLQKNRFSSLMIRIS